MKYNAEIDLPPGWKILPLKRITRFGYGDTLAAEKRAPGNIKVYGSNGPFDTHSVSNTLAPCIILGRKGSYGKLNYSDDPVYAVDTTFIIDKRYTGADLRFLFFLLGTMGLDELSDDIAVPGLSREKAYQALGTLPPLATQRRIAEFLDEKTARIDTLIEKKQELLERLAEKRQALITRAVTKSELTSDRSSKRLKWSVDLLARHPTDEEQKTLPYISNEDIESWTGKLLVEKFEPSDSDGRIFRQGDVLFNKLRPYLAKIYLALFDGVSSGELLCLRPSLAVDPRFLFYVLISKDFIDMVNAETFGAKMPRADWKIVGHQSLCLPPLATQRRSAKFLDEKTAQVDALAEKIQHSISTLWEYRSAQITAAVTGQIAGLT